MFHWIRSLMNRTEVRLGGSSDEWVNSEKFGRGSSWRVNWEKDSVKLGNLSVVLVLFCV